jgi:hypothetical protein
MQKKVISLPTSDSKIYRQILAFMNFMLNLTPQERDVLAELIKLDNEYEALPPDKRGKFILSTDIRKEIRTTLEMEEKQFNVILHKLKKRILFGKFLIDDNGIIHPELKFKPDSDGFRMEVNFVMTAIKPKPFVEELQEAVAEKFNEEAEAVFTAGSPALTPPAEYKYDASQAEVIEEDEWGIEISNPNE